MTTSAAIADCRIHEHLNPHEAARVKRLLECVSQGLCPGSTPDASGRMQSLAACPYVKIDGPSTLCAEHCHLHYLVFEETWP
jgi:hypothetical protein